MPSIDRTTEYDASPEELWAVISDLSTWPEWLTFLKSWTTAPPALAFGAKLEGQITIMSIPMAVAWNVDECTPMKSLSVSGLAVLNSRVAMDGKVESLEGKSHFSLHVQVENPMLVGALAESLMNAIGRDVDASMANFRSRL